jgi:hypothetical protein
MNPSTRYGLPSAAGFLLKMHHNAAPAGIPIACALTASCR